MAAQFARQARAAAALLALLSALALGGCPSSPPPTEGGVPATQAAGLTYIDYENGAAVFSAVSGRYLFDSH